MKRFIYINNIAESPKLSGILDTKKIKTNSGSWVCYEIVLIKDPFGVKQVASQYCSLRPFNIILDEDDELQPLINRNFLDFL